MQFRFLLNYLISIDKTKIKKSRTQAAQSDADPPSLSFLLYTLTHLHLSMQISPMQTETKVSVNTLYILTFETLVPESKYYSLQTGSHV